MLSPRTLHFAFASPAMKHFVSLYRGDAWARTEYDPCDPVHGHYPLDRYCPRP